jgi:hypothetical protein
MSYEENTEYSAGMWSFEFRSSAVIYSTLERAGILLFSAILSLLKT